MSAKISEHIICAPSLDRLIQGYLVTLRSEGKSPHTVVSYKDQLGHFLWWCEKEGSPKDVEHITTAHIRPHVVRDVAALAATGAAPGAVVLEPPTHRVGDLHPVADFVELTQGHGVGEKPVAAPVEGDPDAAVIPHDDPFGIHRIDPHGMVIHMDAHRGLPDRRTPVIGNVHRCGGPVDPLRILGVCILFIAF